MSTTTESHGLITMAFLMFKNVLELWRTEEFCLGHVLRVLFLTCLSQVLSILVGVGASYSYYVIFSI